MLKYLAVLCISLLWQGVAQAADELHYNLVNLQAQVEGEVSNDQLTVMLASEHQGREPAKLADLVNRDMDWALGKLKRQTSIETATMGYSTQPQYRDGRVIGWQAQQQLKLTSTDIAGLTAIIGDLQERLPVKHMQFSPTHETRTQVENSLISAAMQAFKQRAAIVGEQMPQGSYQIVDINVQTGSSHPPMMRAESMMMSVRKADVAPPAVSAGTSKVTVTVSGRVQYDGATQ